VKQFNNELNSLLHRVTSLHGVISGFDIFEPFFVFFNKNVGVSWLVFRLV
jgi:hypothetical protein